jgi:hypothetical protein
MTDIDKRKIMLDIAAHWEQLAEQAHRREQQD